MFVVQCYVTKYGKMVGLEQQKLPVIHSGGWKSGCRCQQDHATFNGSKREIHPCLFQDASGGFFGFGSLACRHSTLILPLSSHSCFLTCFCSYMLCFYKDTSCFGLGDHPIPVWPHLIYAMMLFPNKVTFWSAGALRVEYYIILFGEIQFKL